jgi:hypothetical protein
LNITASQKNKDFSLFYFPSLIGRGLRGGSIKGVPSEGGGGICYFFAKIETYKYFQFSETINYNNTYLYWLPLLKEAVRRTDGFYFSIHIYNINYAVKSNYF